MYRIFGINVKEQYTTIIIPMCTILLNAISVLNSSFNYFNALFDLKLSSNGDNPLFAP